MTKIARRFKKVLTVMAMVLVSMFSVGQESHAFVGQAAKITMEYLDDVLKAAEKVSGKTLNTASRKLLLAQLRNAALKHGDEMMLAARKGGVELIEVAGKYGEDVWSFAAKVPAGARALAMHPQELLPLTRRIGTEVLEVEAKAPGLSRYVVKNFGDDGVRFFGKHVSTDDVTRLVGYAEKADGPATRQLLLDCYKKGGTHFLDKLNWKHIMATGLSAAAVTAAYQIGDGVQEGLMTVAQNSPDTFNDTATHIIDRITQPVVVPATLFGIGLAAIWLFRYYRTSRKKMARAQIE